MASATIGAAKEERENYSGRKMIQEFKDYCIKEVFQPNAENLMAWDTLHNDNKIRETFGSKDDIFKFGLQEKYRIYLQRYAWICAKIVNGKVVTPAFGSIRRNSLGEQQDTSTMNRTELDFQLERERVLIRNAYLRVKVFGLDVKAYRRLVDEALAEFE